MSWLAVRFRRGSSERHVSLESMQVQSVTDIVDNLAETNSPSSHSCRRMSLTRKSAHPKAQPKFDAGQTNSMMMAGSHAPAVANGVG